MPVVVGGYIFNFGGWPGSGQISTVQRATISGTTIGAWSTVTPALPLVLSDGHAFSIPGYVFVVGGYISGTGNQTTIYSTTVDGSGNLGGSWTTTAMPRQYGDFGMAVVPGAFNGYVYSMGGYTTAAQSSVYYASFAAGMLGSWATTTSLPTTLVSFPAAPAL